jgi:hypothetical protein
LQEALAEQKATGRKLGRIFVERGWVTEVQIAKTVARQLRVPFQDVSNLSVRADIARLLPEGQARRLRAMVIESAADSLRVGMADPTDMAGFDEIGRILKREFQLVAVAESQLMALIDRSYSGASEIAGLAEQLTRGAPAANGVRRGTAPPRQRHPHRAAAGQPAHPLSRRRGLAHPNRSRRQDQRRRGPAPEADERAGHF